MKGALNFRTLQGGMKFFYLSQVQSFRSHSFFNLFHDMATILAHRKFISWFHDNVK